MSEWQSIEGLVFTCAACERPNREAVAYKGKPGDIDVALAFVTGCYPVSDRKSPPKRKGPICANCLAHWKTNLRNDHFKQCVEAAGLLVEKLGGPNRGMVFTTHISMTSDRIKGVWIASDSQWQEIAIDADDNRPRRDAWRKGKA